MGLLDEIASGKITAPDGEVTTADVDVDIDIDDAAHQAALHGVEQIYNAYLLTEVSGTSNRNPIKICALAIPDGVEPDFEVLEKAIEAYGKKNAGTYGPPWITSYYGPKGVKMLKKALKKGDPSVQRLDEDGMTILATSQYRTNRSGPCGIISLAEAGLLETAGFAVAHRTY